MNQKFLSVRDLCMIAVFTAIIAVTAQIIIPTPYGVPFTLQTLAIPLAGVILGAKRGTLATIIYVLLGAVGAPVFAMFAGGLGIVFGPTGGFILSFPILAFAAGYRAEKNNVWRLWTGIIGGVLFNYLCGIIWFSLYTSNDLITSFRVCMLIFLPTDTIKIIGTGLLGIKIRKLLFIKNLL